MIFDERVIASESTLPYLVDEALLDMTDSAEILDIGAGNGRLAAAVHEYRDDISVTGVEYDEELAQLPESRHYQQLVAGSADALPFKSESFDAAMLVNTLHEVVSAPTETERLQRLQDASAGITRVLRPGGLLVVYDGVMPPNEHEQVIIEPRSESSRDILQKFAAEYLARPAVLVEADDKSFTTDKGTAATFLTKYAYLNAGTAWEGERRQLYPFATMNQLTSTLEKAGLAINDARSPDPQSRKGLERLLADFTIRNVDGEPYDIESFPVTQVLIKAEKQQKDL